MGEWLLFRCRRLRSDRVSVRELRARERRRLSSAWGLKTDCDPPRRPLAPLFGKVFAALREMPRLFASEHDELQRRWAELLDHPHRTTIGERARARFSDFGPAWPISVFHSPDIQTAAADADAVDRGDYLVVIGDHHPGTSPLGQGLFSYRHPDRQRFLETWGSDVGTPTIYPLPPRGPQVPHERTIAESSAASVSPNKTIGTGLSSSPSSQPWSQRFLGRPTALVRPADQYRRVEMRSQWRHSISQNGVS